MVQTPCVSVFTFNLILYHCAMAVVIKTSFIFYFISSMCCRLMVHITAQSNSTRAWKWFAIMIWGNITKICLKTKLL